MSTIADCRRFATTTGACARVARRALTMAMAMVMAMGVAQAGAAATIDVTAERRGEGVEIHAHALLGLQGVENLMTLQGRGLKPQDGLSEGDRVVVAPIFSGG